MSAPNREWNGVDRRHSVRLRLLVDTLYDRIADLERQLAAQAARVEALERRGLRTPATVRGEVRQRTIRTQRL